MENESGRVGIRKGRSTQLTQVGVKQLAVGGVHPLSSPLLHVLVRRSEAASTLASFHTRQDRGISWPGVENFWLWVH